MVTIYHNTRCGKSRAALQILEETGEPFRVIEYLKTPPSAEDLRGILKKMGKKPLELIRTKEALFKEKYEGRNLSDEGWIAAMVAAPILIQRPIIIRGQEAWIARDAEGLEKIKTGKA